MLERNRRDWEKMPKMCELTVSGPRADSVFVNPMNVRFVRPGTSGCSIHFADNQSISIAMPVSEVIRLLDYAMADSVD